ncbi:MAG: C45 family peptidase, partial [bacterium]|nr:C45 family peptidase [bacterium]
WNRRLARLFQGRQTDQRRLEKDFLKEAVCQAPDLVEEIQAMGEGASVPFKDIFRLNLTELRAWSEKCTTLIFPIQTSQGRKILLAHNEDWDPERNDVFILKVRLPDCSYTVLAYDGYLPGLSSGRNSFGLCHALNYLQPGRIRIGLPRIFLTRRAVTARSIEEVLSYAKKYRRAFGQAIHLAQGSRYLGLEMTATRVNLWEPSLPAIHTNHYLTRPGTANAKSSESSLVRFKRGRELIKQLPKSFSLSEAKNRTRKILSDRATWPYSIWREGDCPEDPGATVASVLLETGSDLFEVTRRRPCG